MDTTAVRDVITASDALQDDADGFAALLTEDVSLINIAGRRLQGRENVRTAYHKALATPLAQIRTRLEIVDIRFVRPDVAVATAVKHVSDERQDTAAAVPGKGTVTFVLTRQNTGWLIASVQTTPVK